MFHGSAAEIKNLDKEDGANYFLPLFCSVTRQINNSTKVKAHVLC